jgi:hypothetical protein
MLQNKPLKMLLYGVLSLQVAGFFGMYFHLRKISFEHKKEQPLYIGQPEEDDADGKSKPAVSKRRASIFEKVVKNPVNPFMNKTMGPVSPTNSPCTSSFFPSRHVPLVHLSSNINSFPLPLPTFFLPSFLSFLPPLNSNFFTSPTRLSRWRTSPVPSESSARSSS